MKNTQRNINKIVRVGDAWKSSAPEATFGNMTLDQFDEQVKPALDSHDRVNYLIAELVKEKKLLADNIKGCVGVAKRAVNGMLAHPDFGYDSPLYAAMGYTRKSDRKTGRTWKTKAAAAEKKAES